MEGMIVKDIFYSIMEDCYHVRFIPELHNKYVACCYGELLVLRDKSTNDCSVLNVSTMERLHLPPLNIPPDHTFTPDCIVSSPKMDRSCRVIFFDRRLRRFWSCHLGDNEFIERESTYRDGCINRALINFKGKLYALTASDWNLIVSDFSDPDLQHEQVVSGESLGDLIFTGLNVHIYLVESCEYLLLIFMGGYDYEVCDVKIFKADFSTGKWVKLDTLGDRVIFLDSCNNTFSAPATTVGLKSNTIYWVGQNSIKLLSPDKHLYMYDMEDKSISMSLPFPTVRTLLSLSWVSLPMTFNKEKKPGQTDMSSLFEVSPTETNFHVQRGKTTIESTELQIEQRKPRKREETETIVRKESLWADLHNDLLLEIFPRLFAGDMVASRSVCRSWYSISPSSKTSQQFVLPLESCDCSCPLLMCPDNKTYHPIRDELYSMHIPDMKGAKVRAARDGWLLMGFGSDFFFYNPFTNTSIFLPFCNAMFYYSVYFSEPPTSGDCLVVVAAMMSDTSNDAICYMKRTDEGWTRRVILQEEKESFHFSYSHAVVYKGLYYFLGYYATLLIFNPVKDEVRVIEAPKYISKLKAEGGEQYMLESDGKLIAVFVGTDGSSVYTCEWNVCTSKWQILQSLGNIMLFVSRPLSLSKRTTVSGTGNKIYFPRVVGDGHGLFYSLATKRYHTFEMGTSYSNFFASKFYPQYNGWFMP